MHLYALVYILYILFLFCIQKNAWKYTWNHIVSRDGSQKDPLLNLSVFQAKNLRTRSVWRTLLWTNFQDFWVSRSLALNRTIQNRDLSRDKDFQKKFLKWSENDELSEEYYSQTRSQLTVIPL